MNVLQSTQSDVTSTVWVDSSSKRIFSHFGGTAVTMTAAEARNLADQLRNAANAADPLVKLEGLQASNEDLSSEHATLGQPA